MLRTSFADAQPHVMDLGDSIMAYMAMCRYNACLQEGTACQVFAHVSKPVRFLGEL